MSILKLQEKMTSGELTAQRIVESYLERIEQLDRQGPSINSIIELNPARQMPPPEPETDNGLVVYARIQT